MNKFALTLQRLALALLAVWTVSCAGNGHPDITGPFQPSFVYTVNAGSNDVSEFSADAQGKLTLFDKIAVGNHPVALRWNETIHSLFVVNAGDNTMTMLNGNTIGDLGGAVTVPTGQNPTSVDSVSTANGYFALVTCAGENDVWIYAIGQNGPRTRLRFRRERLRPTSWRPWGCLWRTFRTTALPNFPTIPDGPRLSAL